VLPLNTPVLPLSTPVLPLYTPVLLLNTPLLPLNTPMLPLNTPVLPLKHSCVVVIVPSMLLLPYIRSKRLVVDMLHVLGCQYFKVSCYVTVDTNE